MEPDHEVQRWLQKRGEMLLQKLRTQKSLIDPVVSDAEAAHRRFQEKFQGMSLPRAVSKTDDGSEPDIPKDVPQSPGGSRTVSVDPPILSSNRETISFAWSRWLRFCRIRRKWRLAVGKREKLAECSQFYRLYCFQQLTETASEVGPDEAAKLYYRRYGYCCSTMGTRMFAKAVFDRRRVLAVFWSKWMRFMSEC
jgi:hypothetical protein